jgi:hypothetical protein
MDVCENVESDKMPYVNVVQFALMICVVCSGCNDRSARKMSANSLHWRSSVPIRAQDAETCVQIRVEPVGARLDVYDDVRQHPCRFSLKNVGSSRVKFLEVIPTCQCTVATLGTMELEPNGEAVLEIVYDAHFQLGELVPQVVVVKTDCPTCPTISCRVTGFRRQRCELDPRVVNFGTVLSNALGS